MSRYTAANEIVSGDNAVQKSHTASYCVALAAGKVYSLASIKESSCHHTTTISVLQVVTEIILTRARPTGSYSPWVGKLEINRKHTALLLVGGMVV